MKLKVPFSEITEHGFEYSITDTSWFPEDLMDRAGPVAASIRLTKKNENKVEVKGNLQACVFLECDRCLKQYTFQVDSPMQLVVEVSEKGEHWKLQDIEPAGVELETISQDKPVVDLSELLRQQLLLALPEKKLCSPVCKGLCSRCGVELNQEECGCGNGTGNSPFAVLENLKKK